MDDNFEELVIDVRASTDGFASDLQAIGSTIDSTLLDSFGKAGATLEKGLLGAIRKGSLGFDELKSVAFNALDQIASHALQSGIGALFGGVSGGQSSGIGAFLGQSLGGLLGLPGRATGGPVGPGRGYIVGERGPEIFIPTSSGRIEPTASGSQGGRDVRVAISLVTAGETSAPVAMQRSSRQIASAVRQAIQSS